MVFTNNKNGRAKQVPLLTFDSRFQTFRKPKNSSSIAATIQATSQPIDSEKPVSLSYDAFVGSL